MLINYVRNYDYDIIRDLKDWKFNELYNALLNSPFEEFYVHYTENKISIYETMTKFIVRNFKTENKCFKISKKDIYIILGK